MAVIIDDLYRETAGIYGLKLLAGRKGIFKAIKWVYLLEDIGNMEFLKGDELVITTGLSSLYDKEWFTPFIHALIESGVSGIILNLGKYIKEDQITDEIIEACNKADVPLFSMPWNTSLTDITSDYCNRIFEERRTIADISSGFKGLLRESMPPAGVKETLLDNGYGEHDKYILAIVDFAGDDFNRQNMIWRLRKAVNNCESSWRSDYVEFEYKERLIVIWHNMHYESVVHHCEEIASLKVKGIKDIHIGLGVEYTDIYRIRVGYNRAVAALAMAIGKQEKIYKYNDMGMYQVLFSTDDRDALKAFCKSRIGILQEYDKVHNAEYVETLEQYLKCNGSLAEVSEALICHRNTINYRMTRIKEMLNTDLSSGTERFNLHLALYISRYLELTEGEKLPDRLETKGRRYR